MGAHADVVVLDPATVGAEPARLVNDLPGDSPRLVADAVGIRRVLCNGVAIVEVNLATGAVPGTPPRRTPDPPCWLWRK